jgi:predicted porin
MNKKLGLAVAGAILALSSTANAGITIPAGDWTVDIGGNVNTFYTNTKFSGDLYRGYERYNDVNIPRKQQVQTGLLPSAIGIGGKTRQNDLDIAFQFTMFVGANSESGFGTTGASPLNGLADGSAASRAGDGNSINVRQAYLTFGDASWGSVKMGRDLGVFGSDAILNDMTLLGVGNGAGAPGNSTLGRIGSGYIYADWMAQIAYTSPNWNGLQFTLAATEPMRNGLDANDGGDTTEDKTKLGWNGKVTYDFSADAVNGRVWAGFKSQKHESSNSYYDYTTHGWDLGGKVNYDKFSLVAYYYDGKGLDTQSGMQLGGLQNGLLGQGKTDDKGGYVQATYVIPTGTKLGVSYGISKSNDAYYYSGPYGYHEDFKNKSWIVGAYHPLTKNLNLVAEYTNQKVTVDVNDYYDEGYRESGKAKTLSLGAILFF